MASYIQINIKTAKAPHFATWYHNRSGQAMSFLTAAVLNYAIKRQFLLIGYAPKDISPWVPTREKITGDTIATHKLLANV